MTVFCEIRVEKKVLSGRLDAVHSNVRSAVSWQGATDLLKSAKIPAWLREMPDTMDASSFKESATLISQALGGSVEIKETGLWQPPDEVTGLNVGRPPREVASGNKGSASEIIRIIYSDEPPKHKKLALKIGDVIEVSGRVEEGSKVSAHAYRYSGIVIAQENRGPNKSLFLTGRGLSNRPAPAGSSRSKTAEGMSRRLRQKARIRALSRKGVLSIFQGIDESQVKRIKKNAVKYASKPPSGKTIVRRLDNFAIKQVKTGDFILKVY